MAAPAIALRFRDTTPDIDTIEQHREIINKHGSVWWGWWKKDFEDDHSDFFAAAEDEMEILILDRSTERMFIAQASDRRLGPNSAPELDLIPQYYHHSTDEVHGWFQLSSIESLEYDNDIAIRFGDSTVVVLDSSVESLPMENFGGETEVAQSSILVLSDLHFGPDYNYLKQGEEAAIGTEKHTLSDCLVQDLKRINLAEDIGAVVITGDFTSNGSWEDQDMDEISEELNALAANIDVDIQSFLTLPGNHDVVRYPKDWDGDVSKLAVSNQVAQKHERDFRMFLNKFQNRDVQLPLDQIKRIRLKDADVLIGLLNSCRIVATTWTEYGYVGRNGIEVIENIGIQSISRPTFKVVGVHHHLLPVNRVEAPKEAGVTLSLDASEILETAQASGVHIAVHGHQHMPHLSRYQSLTLAGGEQKSGLTVISNGSAGVSSKRRPGEERNSYCVFTFSAQGVRLQMRELRSDAKQGSQLYDGEIDATPAMPT